MTQDKHRNAFSAFASVDALTSKPVLGSDGAASWQEFRNNSGKVITKGTAPHIPLKKSDKLGTGFKSIGEERRHEELMRLEGNEAKMNSGYTSFKRKHNQAEIEDKKRQKLIEERIRPDKVKYYIAAPTFEGWKEDYIFTTRERGTGYFWDGMDSLKKLRGESVGVTSSASHSTNNNNVTNISSSNNSNNNDDDESGSTKKEKKKKKKKAKKRASTLSNTIIEDDQNNPMEQVINAMRRRTEILSRPPGSKTIISLIEAKSSLTGTIASSSPYPNATETGQSKEGSIITDQLAKYNWEVATDPSTGKTYYFSRDTGERQWENPIEKLLKGTNVKVGEKEDNVSLPNGWSSAKDSEGRVYYYHRESGKTSWEKPSLK
jgi:hypothetical protein